MHCIEESCDDGLITLYPSFEPVLPPPRSGALRAWKGRIAPFQDGSELGKIVQDLERHVTVDIDVGGCLQHSPACTFNHSEPPYLFRLVRMNVPFDLLVLEFAGKRHRQAYCVRPEISSRTFPTHPHLRRDQIILTDLPVDAICPYRSDEMKYPGLVEYLDYVSIFLAKHLVWVRTLDLVCYSCGISPKIVHSSQRNSAHFALPLRAAGQPFLPWFIDPLSFENHLAAAATGYHIDRWEGIWIGPSAPHDVGTILQTVAPNDECVCGSGERYGVCHRRIHLEMCKAGQQALG